MSERDLREDEAPRIADGREDYDALRRRFAERAITVAVIGLGYVGLPLLRTIGESGIPVIGFDIDPRKIDQLKVGGSYIRHIPGESIAELVRQGIADVTADFTRLSGADAIIVSVPTPITRHRAPDLSYVKQTTATIARHLRPMQLVILESTTYPGTTREVVKPILEQEGLRSEFDFFLAYSPEREDPGNAAFTTAKTPKVVGADGPRAQHLATLLYEHFVVRTVQVSSADVAEAVKLTENVFRGVNIALVNELKLIFDAMGIDIWEVIDAAKTKPFGYTPFYPGPGLGGHCIPIDPFYLTWRAKEFGITTRFIELAGEINTAMPLHVVGRLAQALDDRFRKGLNGTDVLVVGLAYKKNVDDMRESPALSIIDALDERGSRVSYYDPFIPRIPTSRKHPHLAERESIEWSSASLGRFDAALIVTDHDGIDCDMLVDCVPLVVDTRNATRFVARNRDRIVKA
jgi:UDP-N-acetyl-D-glucosamine dehydrogenase